MSQIKNISNEAALPLVGLSRKDSPEAIPFALSTDVFKDHPHSRFALGVLSRSVAPPEGYNDLFTAYLQLRANVYVDQKAILDLESKRDDGTEVDDDDKRSSHLVAVENRGTHAAVISSMRVIEKTETNPEPLPIEAFFNDVLDEPVAIGGNEISRYIHRLDDRKAASQVRSGLFVASLALINKNELSPTLAIVEDDLEASLLRYGVPLERITEPRWIDEYNSTNIGIKIDTKAFADLFGGQEAMQSIHTQPGDFTYWGDLDQ